VCDLSADDLDHPSIWRLTHVKRARCAHRCATCRETIPRGAPYTRTFAVLDGDPLHEAQCDACSAIAERFSTEHGVRPFPSSLLECLRECSDPAAAEIRARLAEAPEDRLGWEGVR